VSGLRVRVNVRRGGFELEAELDVPDGETLALLGPNGSGKSTLLAVVAGLLRPRRGLVRLGGRVLTSEDGSGRSVHVDPERRGIGLLGQEPLLFPHLDALDNVAFGPRAAGAGRRASRETARRWLDALGLARLANLRPSQLSGGQRQRVALARALAAEPVALLLDEPFAALDVEAAADMRELVREHVSARRLTTVLVTHDAAEAALLSDRLVLLRDGRIEQEGPSAAVLAAPRSPFAAALVGAELLTCPVDASGAVVLPGGLPLAHAPLVPGSSATVSYAPGSIAVEADPVGTDGVSIRAFGATRPAEEDRATPRPAEEEGSTRPAEEERATRPAEEERATPRPAEEEGATLRPEEGAEGALRWRGTIASAIPVPGGIRLRLTEHPRLAADVPVTVAARGLVPGARACFTASPRAFTVAVTDARSTSRAEPWPPAPAQD